jgi:hypothetical protein
MAADTVNIPERKALPATVFGLIGVASFVALFANVHKHGWHWPSVSLGALLTGLMISLAVPAHRRTHGWVIRYWIALLAACSVGVVRFFL